MKTGSNTCLPTLRDDVCDGYTAVKGRRCESVFFPLDLTRSWRTARIYVHSQLISLTLQDIEYLSRMFSIVQRQLRDYIVALQDVLPNVTATLTSVTYVEPAPEAIKKIDFPHLYDEIVLFV